MTTRASVASTVARLATPLGRPIFRTDEPCIWLALPCKG